MRTIYMLVLGVFTLLCLWLGWLHASYKAPPPNKVLKRTPVGPEKPMSPLKPGRPDLPSLTVVWEKNVFTSARSYSNDTGVQATNNSTFELAGICKIGDVSGAIIIIKTPQAIAPGPGFQQMGPPGGPPIMMQPPTEAERAAWRERRTREAAQNASGGETTGTDTGNDRRRQRTPGGTENPPQWVASISAQTPPTAQQQQKPLQTRRYYTQGQIVANGYMLKQISADSVVLAKGSDEITLKVNFGDQESTKRLDTEVAAAKAAQIARAQAEAQAAARSKAPVPGQTQTTATPQPGQAGQPAGTAPQNQQARPATTPQVSQPPAGTAANQPNRIIPPVNTRR